jgi:hypothetical protein
MDTVAMAADDKNSPVHMRTGAAEGRKEVDRVAYTHS